MFNELNAHISYENIGGKLFYWRTADGNEIDFIWKRGSKIIAIELKSNTRWKDEYNASFRSFLNSNVKPTACYGIYCGDEILKKDFGLALLWKEFLKRLYAGNAGNIIQ